MLSPRITVAKAVSVRRDGDLYGMCSSWAGSMPERQRDAALCLIAMIIYDYELPHWDFSGFFQSSRHHIAKPPSL